MKVIKDQQTVAFDIDETLFMHDENGFQSIVNPYSNTSVIGCPNSKHIELLKQYKGRGMFTIAWSAAGSEWAETVVKELNLESYVDLVMRKPDKLVDDLPVEEIFPCRIYLK